MDFSKLPFNTQVSFAMVEVYGCKLYIPVDSRDNDKVNIKKAELQDYLINTPPPPLKLA